jgi:hypothetical protein
VILRRQVLDGIAAGTITVAFRRWRRPTVRAGGTLMTPIGQLEIRSLDQIEPERITEAEAIRAGYASRDALLRDLAQRTEGVVYRIELGALRPDPRIALRGTVIDDEAELDAVRTRLHKLDERAPAGPWTRQTLELIAARPAVRAGDLCVALGRDKPSFKTDVRKLKALGLTESLEVGYRLSPRGEAVLKRLREG